MKSACSVCIHVLRIIWIACTAAIARPEADPPLEAAEIDKEGRGLSLATCNGDLRYSPSASGQLTQDGGRAVGRIHQQGRVFGSQMYFIAPCFVRQDRRKGRGQQGLQPP